MLHQIVHAAQQIGVRFAGKLNFGGFLTRLAVARRATVRQKAGQSSAAQKVARPKAAMRLLVNSPTSVLYCVEASTSSCLRPPLSCTTTTNRFSLRPMLSTSMREVSGPLILSASIRKRLS